MDLKTDRVGLLLDQVDSARGILRARLEGLTDEEYLWEPVPDCWSVRPRGQTRSASPAGTGEWVLDSFDYHARPRQEPSPTPFTTIAWRLGHLYLGFSMRWEWTFGARKALMGEVAEFSPFATEATERLWSLLDRWRAGAA